MFFKSLKVIGRYIERIDHKNVGNVKINYKKHMKYTETQNLRMKS